MEFRTFVHKVTGITLDESRSSMLVGRIRKRVIELELKDYESYLQLVKSNRDEETRFTTLITTNETYFYRTPRVWDFIENEFLPKHFQDESKKVKIWSAAASTGDEAHTLGIVCEDFRSKNPAFGYSVLGTDISEKVINKANQGVYKGRPTQRFRDTRPDLFQKYMIGSDSEGFRVNPEIKFQIRFKIHNLFQALSGEQKFDLVLLRNVLIYFSKRDQELVLQNIRKVLSPKGYLIIGESESLNRLDTPFEPVKPLIYRPALKDEREAA
ncbi:MAG: protein-glutamate O-methyltransferase CheR [Pseudomonadota bacterium]